MQQKLENTWSDLENSDAPAGVLKRLLSADWAGELSAAVVKPDNLPALLLELTDAVPIDIESLAQSEAVDLATSGNDNGVTAIQVTLTDQKYRDTFTALSADLVQKVLATATEADGARALVHHLSHWLTFLKKRRFEVLSRERQLGLYGELAVLQDLIAPEVGHAAGVRSWSGPHGAYHDFQLGEIAIEVKTLSATQPQQLHIQTERQLDDRGLQALLIAHIAVDPKHEIGRSLPDVVEQVREGLTTDGADLDVLDDRLLEAGYLDTHAHLYTQTGYTERSVHYYRVGAGFPRIVEDDLRPGLGQVRYLIDASACVPFGVQEDDLRTWLASSPPPTDPVDQEESLRFEFKATAWKATQDNVPDKVINEATIKSVAAFLNAEGGTLVIGVQDRTKEVTGIEADLEHLNEDLDGYENRLTQLLVTSLGAAATKNTHIELETRDQATVCILTVRASPRPVFADSPAAKDRKNLFWVRINNTTRELKGEELIDYIRDHWG